MTDSAIRPEPITKMRFIGIIKCTIE